MAKMTLSRKHPSAALWATVVVVVALVVYPLSWGPACTVIPKFHESPWIGEIYMTVYGPLHSIHENSPQWLRRTIEWYLNVWP